MTQPELTPWTTRLFPLPETTQRGENICSMVNFYTESRRLMDAVGVTRIVEIGSEAGANTGALLAYAKGRGAELIAVDPAEVRFPFDPAGESSFTFFRETSAEFLKRGIAAEIFFLDGDHNYETVTAELEAIHRGRAAGGVKIVFVHDVYWPWARRDIYYDPSRISNPHPFHADNIASPYADGSPGLSPAGYVTAAQEGGSRNGVLTAVEDFLSGHEGWDFRCVPVLYGIGILVLREHLAPEEDEALRKLLDELDSHRELLAVLELNRVENLCRIAGLNRELHEAGEVWRRDQAYIREINERLRETPEDRERELRRMFLKMPSEAWRSRDPLIRRLAPWGLRNRRRVREARRMLTGGKVKLLSLDVFDTLLLRERTSEQERFAGAARRMHLRFPAVSSSEFYEARSLAHRMAYQSMPPTEGCREASAERIFAIMSRILALPAAAVPVMMEAELQYEAGHLRVNPVVRGLLRDALAGNVRVIAVSDMYWSGEAVAGLVGRLLPEAGAISKVYSSSDYGVSKHSGLLFDRVLQESGLLPDQILHAGDHYTSDFLMPYVRCGMRSVWLPRSDFYSRICGVRERRCRRLLRERNVIHGV